MPRDYPGFDPRSLDVAPSAPWWMRVGVGRIPGGYGMADAYR